MSILPPAIIGDGHCEVGESYHNSPLGYLSIPVNPRRPPRKSTYQAAIGRFIWMQPYQSVNEPLADSHLAKEIIDMVKEAGCSTRCNVELGQHRVWACMDFGSANFLIFRLGVEKYMVDLILCAQQKMIPWVYIKDVDFNNITGNPQVFVAAVNGDMDWDLPGMYYLMSQLKGLPYSEEVLGRIEAEEQMEQASQ